MCFLAAFGALSIFKFVLDRVSPSPLEAADGEFNEPEKIEGMISLYKHIQKKGANSVELEEHIQLRPYGPDFFSAKEVPVEWIPELLQQSSHTWGRGNSVVAYFNEAGSLEALEFDGSRFGCFISHKPTLIAAWFGSSRRIFEKKNVSGGCYITIFDRET